MYILYRIEETTHKNFIVFFYCFHSACNIFAFVESMLNVFNLAFFWTKGGKYTKDNDDYSHCVSLVSCCETWFKLRSVPP